MPNKKTIFKLTICFKNGLKIRYFNNQKTRTQSVIYIFRIRISITNNRKKMNKTNQMKIFYHLSEDKVSQKNLNQKQTQESDLSHGI